MASRKLIVEIVGDSRSLDRAFKHSQDSASRFSKTMKKLAIGIGVGVGIAFVGIGAALKRGFGELMESQKALAQTRAVLQLTGGVANVTAGHVDALASSLSLMSSVDDEVIAGGENMLLTFTNIRNGVGKGPKIFDQATKAVLDLSVATGKDMTTAAIMVGKALNDTTVNAKGTITGWSALRRVGVMITPAMQKQGAALIKAGKPMKAQMILLKELRKEFGGSAKQFGLTLPAAFSRLRNAVDEVLGAFAQGLAPVVQRVANLLSKKLADPAFMKRVRELGRIIGERLYKAFTDISAWFKENWPAIMKAWQDFSALVMTTVDGIEKVVGFFQKISGFLDKGSTDLEKQAVVNAWAKATPEQRKKFLASGQATVDVNGDIHVHGVENPNQLAEKIHRQSKKKTKQTRGRSSPGIYHK